MKQHLRLALPALNGLTSETPIPFVTVTREGRIAREGELTAPALATEFKAYAVHAVLHPEDAVVARISVPPLTGRRLDAAVAGSIEPMALSDIEQLCIAHGPRAADGSIDVAWVSRKPLLDAWTLLADAGLDVELIVPHGLAIPVGDAHPDSPLRLPAGARWLAPLPEWSFAHDDLRPASAGGRWRKAAWWVAAAAAVWILGLNIHAARLQNEVLALQQDMRRTVMEAFPRIPVVIDPVRQAQSQRDALRQGQGGSADDDFMPLALATAQVLGFAQGHVRGLVYENGVLTLTLAEGYAPPTNEAALMQSAAVQQILLEKSDDEAHVWRSRRVAASSGRRDTP